MASSIEIEEDVKFMDAGRDCYKEGTDARDNAYAATGNWDTATGIGLDVMADCLESTKPVKQITSY
jgi:hypothetical protein